MRSRGRIQTWWGRGIVLGAAMLVLGISLCLFDGDGDGDHHDDRVAQDLCLGMIAASLAVALLAGPLENGWVSPEPRRLVHTVSPHLPDPPPKSVLRS